MRIDGQQAALKVAASPAEETEGELEFFGLLNGMGHEQIVNALIGNDKGKTVDEFKSFLAECSCRSNVHNSKSCFMNQLQGHARG